MKKCVIYILLITLFVSCSPVRHSFSVEKGIEASFFDIVFDQHSENRRVMQRPDTVTVYRVQFKEIPVEVNQLIEFTTTSDTSKLTVDYVKTENVWYDAYLFSMSLKGKKSYIYVSLKFRSVLDDSTWKSECIGFGPAYYGTGAIVNSKHVIQFLTNLKIVKRDHEFKLKKPCAGKKNDLLFVSEANMVNDRFITVSRVVNSMNNKVGGRKDEVFIVDSVFAQKRALTFSALEKEKRYIVFK